MADNRNHNRGGKRGRGGRPAAPTATTSTTATAAAPPVTMQQVAAMLEQATRAVRTVAQPPLTLESVRAMTDQQIRQDPALNHIFNRGWNACVTSVAKTARREGDQPATKKRKTTPATPAVPRLQPRTERVPPLPSQWSVLEKARVLGFNPHTNPHPTNTLGRGDRPSRTRGNSRATTAVTTPRATTQDVKGETAKERNYLRFRDLVARKKARKAEACSQQFRLDKNPGPSSEPTPSTSGTPLTPSPAPTNEETPMETDELPPDVSEVALSREEEDFFLDASPVSLPDVDEMDPPPTFKDDPPL